LDIFSQLEERNLFLIQNVQENEEQLEELKQKFRETEIIMEERTKQLNQNISDLNAKIKIENEKAEALKKRTRANSDAEKQQELLQALSDKVKQVHHDCGFDATQTDTLEMLREIEGWFEFMLKEIKRMDPKKVEEAERKKEGDRRDRLRKVKKRRAKKNKKKQNKPFQFKEQKQK